MEVPSRTLVLDPTTVRTKHTVCGLQILIKSDNDSETDRMSVSIMHYTYTISSLGKKNIDGYQLSSVCSVHLLLYCVTKLLHKQEKKAETTLRRGICPFLNPW